MLVLLVVGVAGFVAGGVVFVVGGCVCAYVSFLLVSLVLLVRLWALVSIIDGVSMLISCSWLVNETVGEGPCF